MFPTSKRKWVNNSHVWYLYVEGGEEAKVDVHLLQEDQHLGLVPLPVVKRGLPQVLANLVCNLHLADNR